MSDDQIDLNQPYDAEAGVAQAKKTFSLRDRLKGVSHRTAKILIFTDEPAIDKYNRFTLAIREKQIRLSAIAEIDSFKDEIAEINADLAELEDFAEEAKSDMLEGALSFHLKGTAKEAVSAAQRKGRKTYADKQGNVPTDKMEDFSNFLLTEYLLLTVQKIVDADGNEADFDRDDLYGMAIGRDLPPSQSKRLELAVNNLIQIDGYEQAATEDPGF